MIAPRVSRILAVLAGAIACVVIGLTLTSPTSPVPERAGAVHPSGEHFIWTARGPIRLDQVLGAMSADERQGETCTRSGKHKAC